MSFDDSDGRRRAAEQRRAEIAGCRLCDERGYVTGRQSLDGITRDAAWRCDHTDRPLPRGFVPDGGPR